MHWPLLINWLYCAPYNVRTYIRTYVRTSAVYDSMPWGYESYISWATLVVIVSIISSHVTVTQYAHVHTILFQMLCQHGFLDLTPTPQVQLFMSNASMHTYLLSHAGMHIMCFANTDYHAISRPVCTLMPSGICIYGNEKCMHPRST